MVAENDVTAVRRISLVRLAHRALSAGGAADVCKQAEAWRAFGRRASLELRFGRALAIGVARRLSRRERELMSAAQLAPMEPLYYCVIATRYANTGRESDPASSLSVLDIDMRTPRSPRAQSMQLHRLALVAATSAEADAARQSARVPPETYIYRVLPSCKLGHFRRRLEENALRDFGVPARALRWAKDLCVQARAAPRLVSRLFSI